MNSSKLPDLDIKTRKIIEEIDQEVCDELHSRGMLLIVGDKYRPAYPGVIIIYEAKIQTKLASEGIGWQTFTETSPNVLYD
jgi:hypothetical protein